MRRGGGGVGVGMDGTRDGAERERGIDMMRNGRRGGDGGVRFDARGNRA
jgi:hypothetical protein